MLIGKYILGNREWEKSLSLDILSLICLYETQEGVQKLEPRYKVGNYRLNSHHVKVAIKQRTCPSSCREYVQCGEENELRSEGQAETQHQWRSLRNQLRGYPQGVGLQSQGRGMLLMVSCVMMNDLHVTSGADFANSHFSGGAGVETNVLCVSRKKWKVKTSR